MKKQQCVLNPRGAKEEQAAQVKAQAELQVPVHLLIRIYHYAYMLPHTKHSKMTGNGRRTTGKVQLFSFLTPQQWNELLLSAKQLNRTLFPANKLYILQLINTFMSAAYSC